MSHRRGPPEPHHPHLAIPRRRVFGFQLSFMTVTVAAALCVTPLFGILAERLYDQEEIERLRAEAADAKARAEMVEHGWIGLPASARPTADALHRDLGVEILHAAEPFTLPLQHGPLSGHPPTHHELDTSTRLVTDELGRYPKSFVEATQLRRVLLCRNLRESGRPIPSLPNYVSTLVIDVDAPDRYARRLVHHELYHFADLADDEQVRRDEDWAALNDRFFVYGDGGRFMRDPGASKLTDGVPGFLTLYATSAVEEDKAEIFAFLMVEPERVAEIARQDPVVARKVAAMKDRVARLSPEMDEAFWSRQVL